MNRYKQSVVVVCALWLCAAGARAEDVVDIAPQEVVARWTDARAPLVIDVRSAEEYAAGHVPGAVNVPQPAVATEVPRLVPDLQRELVVYCASGRRAAMALSTLKAQGYTHLRHLAGDYNGWAESGRPVEPPKPVSVP
jgi:phage shock protein E